MKLQPLKEAMSDYFPAGVNRAVGRMRDSMFPATQFIEDNRKDVQQILDAAKDLRDVPTRHQDRLTISALQDRANRALLKFQTTRNPSAREDLAKQIQDHLMQLQSFTEEFGEDEKRMGWAKKKAERDWKKEQNPAPTPEGTTFKGYLAILNKD